MADEPDPPPKTYGFKPREFKRDNAPVSEAGRMPTAAELAKVASAGRIVAPVPVRGPKAGDPNDVFATLQVNRSAEIQTDPIEMEKRERYRYRRKRDFWLILAPMELALGTVAFLARHNAMVVIGAFAGMVLVGVGLAWIMWQVMDRY
jgi:hypothetical protein